MKKKNIKGVIVKFEILDDYDNVIKVIAEKSFPNVSFDSWKDHWNPRFIHYRCFNKEVSEYVQKQHDINDLQFHYEDWENSPNVVQSFYNIDGELMYTVDEVDYEMNI